MPFSVPVFWALALSWLPLGILLTAVIRHLPGLSVGGPPAFLFTMLVQSFSLVLIAPCGLPLALAWQQTCRIGHARAAWTAFGILAPLTTLASLFAGLLGPFAIAAYAVFLSLPAWILFAVLRAKSTPLDP